MLQIYVVHNRQPTHTVKLSGVGRHARLRSMHTPHMPRFSYAGERKHECVAADGWAHAQQRQKASIPAPSRICETFDLEFLGSW